MLPSRDDDVAAWLKRERDQYRRLQMRAAAHVIGNLLDEYRLHADTGTPLLQHACDGPHCCNAEVCSKCGTAGCLEDARSGWYDDEPDSVVDPVTPRQGHEVDQADFDRWYCDVAGTGAYCGPEETPDAD